MYKSGIILSFAILAIVVCLGERARYDNYRVYRVQPSHLEELEILKKLQSSTDSIIFLNEIHAINRSGDLVVAPHKVADFLQLMQEHHIDYTLIESNLQQQIDQIYKDVANDTQRTLNYGWKNYYELADTYRWLQSLADTYGMVSMIEAGTTYQGRRIRGIKISKGNTAKPGIFLEAGIHAREWIGPATATYVINELLTSKEPRINKLVDKYDWYIIPHANPDGYVYTHVKDRMWRKTRTPYGACYGADPNRNWGFAWNSVGSTDNPCTDTFAGPSEFSEIETRSLSEYITSLKGKLSLYISFHAFSQLLLYPYGHTPNLPENHKDLEQVFKVSVDAIQKRYGTKYTGGNIYDAIYPASGASIDWAYATIGTKMSFCYELRPSSNSILTGFNLPASQIIPTGEETLDSIVAMVDEVDKLGYFKL